MKQIELSIITVNYKVGEKIEKCLLSIEKHFKTTNYEVIIVENDVSVNLKKEFEAHKNVTYIKSKRNVGFGAGNNIGAKAAKGKYLFFLNPDTLIDDGSIEKLLSLFKDEKVGIIAPLLLDTDKKPYPKQGTLKLTPITALFSLSFISKYFPNNTIASKFWLKSWNKKTTKEVDVAPGTAFVIKRDVFLNLGGFDEKFFLFFEENDLCNRLKSKGYKIYITPDLKVIHEWGKSTEQKDDTKNIFDQSRQYYLKKHYGYIGTVTNMFLGSQSKRYVLDLITCVFVMPFALFLRVLNLNSLMAFIPDQGWFYLSARDMLLTGQIPLVGPPTSHPWIHHGALWTYTLALLLALGGFEPVLPAYFIALLGVLTVFLLYVATRIMFSPKVAFLATFLYACSPLVVLNARIPYHTSPIPFFVILLFLSMYKLTKGNAWMFPIITFLLGVLYNHEITTAVYGIPIVLLIAGGMFFKKQWVSNLRNKKILFVSLVSFLLPMTPFILYDISNGYKQTVGFAVWAVYRVVKVPLSLVSSQFVSSGSNPSTLPEFFTYYTQLILIISPFVSFIVLCISLVFVAYTLYKTTLVSFNRNATFLKRIHIRITNLPISLAMLFLFLFLGCGLIGLFIHRVPIEADTLLVAPFIIVLTSVSILWLCREKFVYALTITLFIAALNAYFLLSTNFLTQLQKNSRVTHDTRMKAVERVIEISNGKPYTIRGEGELSSFPVFTMPYEYLLWWKGYPVTKNAKQVIVVKDKGAVIEVYKK